MKPDSQNSPPRAWVVFSGQADRPWLRLLRPGFRHCFVIMNDGNCWLSLDPMLHQMDVKVHHDLPPGFDLPGWLAGRGQCVVPAPLAPAALRPAPWRLFTCVEAVKRVLGLHARGVYTPWQLYRHLSQRNFSQKIKIRKLNLSKGERSWEA